MESPPKKVCVQGLGFVGAAMSVAVASACSPSGEFLYDVIGVDQDTDSGRQRVADIEAGRFPFSAQDPTLIAKLDECHGRGNLHATTDIEVYASADVVVIDVSLDIEFKDEEPRLDLKGLKAAFLGVAKRVPEGALILVETTVPPGTCAKVRKPILEEVSRFRG